MKILSKRKFYSPPDQVECPTPRPAQPGDLYEMVGRQRTVWTVERLVTVPGKGILIDLSQIGGVGRLTVKAIDLFAQTQFRRISSATL